MESIITAVEGAIGAVETEAKKVEHAAFESVEEYIQHAHKLVAEVEEVAQNVTAEDFASVDAKLMALVSKLHPTYHAVLTQVEKDTLEDAVVIRGTLSRAWHRFIAWI